MKRALSGLIITIAIVTFSLSYAFDIYVMGSALEPHYRYAIALMQFLNLKPRTIIPTGITDPFELAKKANKNSLVALPVHRLGNYPTNLQVVLPLFILVAVPITHKNSSIRSHRDVTPSTLVVASATSSNLDSLLKELLEIAEIRDYKEVKINIPQDGIKLVLQEKVDLMPFGVLNDPMLQDPSQLKKIRFLDLFTQEGFDRYNTRFDGLKIVMVKDGEGEKAVRAVYGLFALMTTDPDLIHLRKHFFEAREKFYEYGRLTRAFPLDGQDWLDLYCKWLQ